MSQESSLHIPSRKHISLEKNLQHKYKSLSWSRWNPESALQSFYLTQPLISTFLKGFLWDFLSRDINTPHLFLQSIFRASYETIMLREHLLKAFACKWLFCVQMKIKSPLYAWVRGVYCVLPLSTTNIQQCVQHTTPSVLRLYPHTSKNSFVGDKLLTFYSLHFILYPSDLSLCRPFACTQTHITHYRKGGSPECIGPL